jgi:hypothetical protein
MKIRFFIEDMHLPQMISKYISGHLITRTANEKHRKQNCKMSVSRMDNGITNWSLKTVQTKGPKCQRKTENQVSQL